MKYIPLTQGKKAIVDDDMYEALSYYTWHYHQSGYAFTHIPGEGKKLRMHHGVLGRLPNHEVDHINGNRIDNRRENLRHAIPMHNKWNKTAQSNSSSGFKGVSWSKQAKKFRTRIVADGKEYYLGFYDTAIDGAKAYNEAAVRIHGKYAHLNELPNEK